VSPQEQIVRIRGDQKDVFSHGFICPKGSTLKQLHEDPDRLRRPLVKRDGKHVEVSWEEAWQVVHAGLNGVIARHGRGSLAAYAGNPGAHNTSSMFSGAVLRSMGSHNRFSASSVDQLPKHVAGGYMFGAAAAIPVPDLDHTDYLLMLGANPYASNGSLCTAPDFPGRIQAIRARGGKVVVVDPRRTKTADESDEWVSIRPGTDGLFLAAIAHVLYAQDRVKVEARLRPYLNGLEELRTAVLPFSPQRVAKATGISADVIKRIATELSNAPTAAVYGRIGVNTVAFGTVNAWLIDAINVISGNIDRRGGAMFTLPVAGGPLARPASGKGQGFRTGRGTSRVSGMPEAIGEYPVAVLAEEILTPGDGQVRALITLAGNPILSTPNGKQLERAFSELEFMISVDIYLNETTRFADVILPSPSALQKDHYDLALLQFAIRNVANYSPAVLPLDEDAQDEWEIFAKLAGILQGMDADIDASVVDDVMVRAMIGSSVGSSSSPVFGRDVDEIYEELSRDGRRGPARMIDFAVQAGPYGAGFGAQTDGVSLQMLLDNPHGIDMGPLEPRLPELLRTSTGKIELAPPTFLADLVRLEESIELVDDSQMLLIGRRELKSNNSWMHNIKVLTKGSLSCTAQLHPIDAARMGVITGDIARITSKIGSIDIPVEVTESIRQGVVSVPHGWGHGVAGTKMGVAAEKAGVNSNILSDHEAIDPLSGTSVLNAIPVTVSAVND